MTTILYGIPNCDTVKKARKWLEANNIVYQFHDFRKQGLDEALLADWFQSPGWEALLNKRGTTWRQQPQQVKDAIDSDSAKQLMLDNPAIIKRPVTVTQSGVSVGFKPDQYSELFSK